MTETLSPWRRMSHSLVISLCLHVLILISIVQGYGGRSGSYSIPGILPVALVPAGGLGPTMNAAPDPTPFPAQPGFRQNAPPGPVPSLSTSAAEGHEREPSTPRDQSDQPSAGDQVGFHSGRSGTNAHANPAVDQPIPATNGGAAGPSNARGPLPPLPPAQIEPIPRCASCPDPPYPDLAQRRGVEGEVLLSVQVLPDGRVGDLFVVRSSGFPFLDDAALAAVKGWTFYPATNETGPVEATVNYPVRFRLTGP